MYNTYVTSYVCVYTYIYIYIYIYTRALTRPATSVTRFKRAGGIIGFLASQSYISKGI